MTLLFQNSSRNRTLPPVLEHYPPFLPQIALFTLNHLILQYHVFLHPILRDSNLTLYTFCEIIREWSSATQNHNIYERNYRASATNTRDNRTRRPNVPTPTSAHQQAPEPCRPWHRSQNHISPIQLLPRQSQAVLPCRPTKHTSNPILHRPAPCQSRTQRNPARYEVGNHRQRLG